MSDHPRAVIDTHLEAAAVVVALARIDPTTLRSHPGRFSLRLPRQACPRWTQPVKVRCQMRLPRGDVYTLTLHLAVVTLHGILDPPRSRTKCDGQAADAYTKVQSTNVQSYLRMLLPRASASTSRGVGTFWKQQRPSRQLHIFWEDQTLLLAVFPYPPFMYNVRLGMGDTTWVPASPSEELPGSKVEFPKLHVAACTPLTTH